MSKPAECLLEIMIYPYLWVSGLVLQGPQQFGGEVPRSLGGAAPCSLEGIAPVKHTMKKPGAETTGSTQIAPLQSLFMLTVRLSPMVRNAESSQGGREFCSDILIRYVSSLLRAWIVESGACPFVNFSRSKAKQPDDNADAQNERKKVERNDAKRPKNERKDAKNQ